MSPGPSHRMGAHAWSHRSWPNACEPRQRNFVLWRRPCLRRARALVAPLRGLRIGKPVSPHHESWPNAANPGDAGVPPRRSFTKSSQTLVDAPTTNVRDGSPASPGFAAFGHIRRCQTQTPIRCEGPGEAPYTMKFSSTNVAAKVRSCVAGVRRSSPTTNTFSTCECRDRRPRTRGHNASSHIDSPGGQDIKTPARARSSRPGAAPPRAPRLRSAPRAHGHAVRDSTSRILRRRATT